MDEINEKFQISLCQDASLQAGLKNIAGNQPAEKIVRKRSQVPIDWSTCRPAFFTSQCCSIQPAIDIRSTRSWRQKVSPTMEWWKSAKIYLKWSWIFQLLWNYIVTSLQIRRDLPKSEALWFGAAQWPRITYSPRKRSKYLGYQLNRLTKWVLPGAGKIRFVRMFRIPEITALQRDPLCETVSLLDLLVPSSCELCRALFAGQRPRKSVFTLPTFAAKGKENLSFSVENNGRIQLKPRFIQRQRDVQKLQVDQMNH